MAGNDPWVSSVRYPDKSVGLTRALSSEYAARFRNDSRESELTGLKRTSDYEQLPEDYLDKRRRLDDGSIENVSCYTRESLSRKSSVKQPEGYERSASDYMRDDRYDRWYNYEGSSVSDFGSKVEDTYAKFADRYTDHRCLDNSFVSTQLLNESRRRSYSQEKDLDQEYLQKFQKDSLHLNKSNESDNLNRGDAQDFRIDRDSYISQDLCSERYERLHSDYILSKAIDRDKYSREKYPDSRINIYSSLDLNSEIYGKPWDEFKSNKSSPIDRYSEGYSGSNINRNPPRDLSPESYSKLKNDDFGPNKSYECSRDYYKDTRINRNASQGLDPEKYAISQSDFYQNEDKYSRSSYTDSRIDRTPYSSHDFSSRVGSIEQNKNYEPTIEQNKNYEPTLSNQRDDRKFEQIGYPDKLMDPYVESVSKYGKDERSRIFSDVNPEKGSRKCIVKDQLNDDRQVDDNRKSMNYLESVNNQDYFRGNDRTNDSTVSRDDYRKAPYPEVNLKADKDTDLKGNHALLPPLNFKVSELLDSIKKETEKKKMNLSCHGDGGEKYNVQKKYDGPDNFIGNRRSSNDVNCDKNVKNLHPADSCNKFPPSEYYSKSKKDIGLEKRGNTGSDKRDVLEINSDVESFRTGCERGTDNRSSSFSTAGGYERSEKDRGNSNLGSNKSSSTLDVPAFDRRVASIESRNDTGLVKDNYNQSGIHGDYYNRSRIQSDDYNRSRIQSDDYKKSGIHADDYNLSVIHANDYNQSSMQADYYNQSRIQADDYKKSGIHADHYNQSIIHANDYNQSSIQADNYNQSRIQADDYTQSRRHAGDYNQSSGYVDDYYQSSSHVDNYNQSKSHVDNYNQSRSHVDNYNQSRKHADDYKQPRPHAGSDNFGNVRQDEYSQLKGFNDKIYNLSQKEGPRSYPTAGNDTIFYGSGVNRKSDSNTIKSVTSNVPSTNKYRKINFHNITKTLSANVHNQNNNDDKNNVIVRTEQTDKNTLGKLDQNLPKSNVLGCTSLPLSSGDTMRTDNVESIARSYPTAGYDRISDVNRKSDSNTVKSVTSNVPSTNKYRKINYHNLTKTLSTNVPNQNNNINRSVITEQTDKNTLRKLDQNLPKSNVLRLTSLPHSYGDRVRTDNVESIARSYATAGYDKISDRSDFNRKSDFNTVNSVMPVKPKIRYVYSPHGTIVVPINSDSDDSGRRENVAECPMINVNEWNNLLDNMPRKFNSMKRKNIYRKINYHNKSNKPLSTNVHSQNNNNGINNASVKTEQADKNTLSKLNQNSPKSNVLRPTSLLLSSSYTVRTDSVAISDGNKSVKGVLSKSEQANTKSNVTLSIETKGQDINVATDKLDLGLHTPQNQPTIPLPVYENITTLSDDEPEIIEDEDILQEPTVEQDVLQEPTVEQDILQEPTVEHSPAALSKYNILGPYGKLVILAAVDESPLQSLARTKSMMRKDFPAAVNYDEASKKWTCVMPFKGGCDIVMTDETKNQSKRAAGRIFLKKLREHYYTLVIKQEIFSPGDVVVHVTGDFGHKVSRKSLLLGGKYAGSINVEKIKSLIVDYKNSDAVHDLIFSIMFPPQVRKELQSFGNSIGLKVRKCGGRRSRYLVLSKFQSFWKIIQGVVNNDSRYLVNYKLLPPGRYDKVRF